MNVLTELLNGFAGVMSPANLGYAAIGVLIGTLVGMLPGIGPALTIALLLPVSTQLVDTTDNASVAGALIMFAGVYYGAMYGGSTTSILLNTPGESNSVASAIEGYQMARRGRAKAALATAAIGSFVAATLSTLVLTFFAVPIATLAVQFQNPDYFALGVLALVSVTALLGKSIVRGMMSLSLGLFLGLVGIDSQTGQVRFSLRQFDWAVESGLSVQLSAQISITLVIVGLFALGESLYISGRAHQLPGQIAPLNPAGGNGWMTGQDWKRSWLPWLRGTALGFPFGALPAGGAEIPTFLSYTLEKYRSRHKKQFGKGAIEGVAGPEAANNAAFTGVLIPLLALGIPTSATAAVMLASFKSFDVPTGLTLFDQRGSVVWMLIASLYVGNLMLLILNLPLIRLWVMVLRVPRPILYAAILVFAVVGVYTTSQNVFLMIMTIVIGVIALFMRMYEFPIAPVILGAILGPLLEKSFRKTMQGNNNDWSEFVTRPLSASLLALAFLALVLPFVPRLIARWKGRNSKAAKLSFGADD